MGLMLGLVMSVVMDCSPLITHLYSKVKLADNNSTTNQGGQSSSSQKVVVVAELPQMTLLALRQPFIKEVRKNPISLLSFILFNTRITGTTQQTSSR